MITRTWELSGLKDETYRWYWVRLFFIRRAKTLRNDIISGDFFTTHQTSSNAARFGDTLRHIIRRLHLEILQDILRVFLFVVGPQKEEGVFCECILKDGDEGGFGVVHVLKRGLQPTLRSTAEDVYSVYEFCTICGSRTLITISIWLCPLDVNTQIFIFFLAFLLK